MQAPWVGGVLSFWFGELATSQWFKKDAALDADIARRFGPLYESVRKSFALDTAIVTLDSALAHAIVLDQFPRNMFRDTARAFESDRLALAVAEAAVSRGLDRQIESSRRLFIYLPFEHSEALGHQKIAVDLISELGDANLLKYAVAHHDIIARFGRFPHRNAILGRTSTPEEQAFLELPGSSF